MKTSTLLIVLTTFTIGLAAGFNIKTEAEVGLPNVLPINIGDFEFKIESSPITFVGTDISTSRPMPGHDIIVVGYTTPFFYSPRHLIKRRHYVPVGSGHQMFKKLLEVPHWAEFRIKENSTSEDEIILIER